MPHPPYRTTPRRPTTSAVFATTARTRHLRSRRPALLPGGPAHAADLELARRAASGDREAIERLVDRLAVLGALVRAQHRRVGAPLGHEELADVVQNAFVAIWRKLASYEGRAALETWFYRFCSNELLRAIQRRFSERCIETEDEDLVALAGAESRTEAAVESELLEESLDALDTAQGIVVRAHVLEQRTFPEIANDLRIPLGTAKTHYYRGLVRLRKLLARVVCR